MKIPALFTATLLLTATAVHAQDLQFRTVVQSDMPGMGGADMPRPTMTMYYKGSKMRIDTEMPMGTADPPNLPEIMKMTVIMDRATNKMFMLNHEEKAYHEQPFEAPQLNMDSAQAQAMSEMQQQFKQTGDTLTINGYKTRRWLMSLELPFNPLPKAKENERVLMVMEHWGATDPVLMEAYRLMQAIAPSMSGAAAGANASMFAQMAQAGFPVRSTVLMVTLPNTRVYDVEKILKAGAAAEGLQMRIVTEMKDIKTGPLDPALFEVPKDYKKN